MASSRTSCAVLPGSWLVGGLGFSVLLLALLMGMVRLTLSPLAIDAGAIYAVAGTAFALRYAYRGDGTHRHNVVRDCSEYTGLFMAVCLFGAMASYPIAAANHGFADARLEAIDRALWFNWTAWYDLVAAHPTLQWLGRAVYQSIFVTPFILFGYFAFTGRRGEARLFIASFWVAAILTLALFSLMPAEGPLAFLEQGRITYMPISALYQAEVIPALRDHALRSVDPGSMHGLVCAPSFHAASAILYMAAAWQAKPLRWPLLALNVAMLLATPVEGTHYLIDIIGGIGVAVVGRLVATALVQISAPARKGEPQSVAAWWRGPSANAAIAARTVHQPVASGLPPRAGEDLPLTLPRWRTKRPPQPSSRRSQASRRA